MPGWRRAVQRSPARWCITLSAKGALSLSPEQLEYAELLLRRAIGDLKAYRVLEADQQISDENVGFHAQQAVEKALKVALVLAGADFSKTHDLDFLVARVRESGSEPPPELEGLGWLTPWGTNFR